MDTNNLSVLDNAIKADYRYLRIIRDESGADEANTTISFYTRFIEGIVNGLNSIYKYHHAEEFVGRFMARNHLFALDEKEFEKFAENLADEMILTGNIPAGSILREKVIPRIILLLKRWFYVLDSIEDKDFRKLKKTISAIIAYDITTIFIPSNLDTVLLQSYADQFSSPVSVGALLNIYSKELELPDNFGRYLSWKQSMPENWDSHDDKKKLEQFKPILEKQLEQKPLSEKEISISVIQRTVQYAQKQYKKEISLFEIYNQGYNAVVTLLRQNETIGINSQLVVQALNGIPGFPSQAFAEESVGHYVEEKLLRWAHLIDNENKEKALPLVAHDILRTFYTQEIDTFLIMMAREQAKTDRALFLIISGWALKFSDKFISYSLFKMFFPYWDDFKDLESAATITPRITAALYSVNNSFASIKSLPRNRYAPLTKNFTSFYTLKKLFELFYDKQEEMGNKDDRIDEIYKEIKPKETDASTEDKLKELITVLNKTPKRVSEDQFDEIVYLALKQEMGESNMDSLGDLLSDKKIRDKYQKLVYIRYDAFTFNRIMATNYGGLGNLFGTKGFIILIEAYLIGSGLEHVINYFVVGGLKTFFNIGTVINDTIITGTFMVNPIVAEELGHVFDTTFNISPESFGAGWQLMNWGRTAMSVFIPIFLMFLITVYNYLFFKLNRVGNREKSFQRLSFTTERWISGKSNIVQLFKKREYSVFFELFKVALLIIETVWIIGILYNLGFEPTQLALFFFLLATICLSAFQGNKLKDEVTLGQSEAISDTVRDFIFIPIIELGKFLGGQARSINFIPWLVQTGVEPLYKYVVSILQSFISFQKEKKEEIL